ncbi:OLC1v1003347C5 [Oldenlandia corymbosa var. corymbosa]|uniref:OLC1v1003347C5 n=1 Tax=Oldenlandia corymbosa var. corymbosa TaxID=529605 RepID=A0AAV1D9U7_OLDCO|nr:OLC1v1003347C5 [Oldenlandia corymbosa var. corymbosa]
MDQKTWLWRKRSSEKTIIANGKNGFDLKGKVEEVILPNEKEAALEETVKILTEKLASLTSECTAKDELLKDQGEQMQEAEAGKEKADKEILLLKQQLDEASAQKLAANERLSNLNAAFKDCMEQLKSVREEKEQSVHDVIARTSTEYEKAHKKLEDKLAETSKKVASLTVENSHLLKALQVKEKLIEDLSDQRCQTEAEFNALMARLDSVEKENAFLRYEFRMLEKDLDTRNEELKIVRRSLDASEKHYVQNVNKMKKLEAECQRLRVLVRKRLPAPTHLATMKAEFEMQERFQIETRRRKMNSVTGGLVARESSRENVEISGKRISFLVERLQNVEQENKVLRDLLMERPNDLSPSPRVCNQVVPLSLKGESRVAEHHKVETSRELDASIISSNKDYERGSSRSWDSNSISGLENFKNGVLTKTPEHKVLGINDMSLMDDFAEMEKLAIVAVDVPHDNVYASSEGRKRLSGSLKDEKCHDHVESTGMELVPVGQEFGESTITPTGDWLQATLKTIMEQVRVSGKSIYELLEDIKMALQAEIYETGSSTPSKSEMLPVSGYIAWRSPITSPSVASSKGVLDLCSSVENINRDLTLSVRKSINRLVELVRRLYSGNSEGCNGPKKTEDYAVHVFGWNADELCEIMQRFIGTCNLILDGNSNFEKFSEELSIFLDWIVNRCITKDGYSSGYDLKQHLCGNVWTAGTELGSTQRLLLEMEKIQSILELENKGLKTELSSLKSSQKSLELSLQSAREKSDTLSNDFEHSQQSIHNLRIELETLSESKRMIEDQFENQKMINEELDTQLNVARANLNDVSQKLSSLEVELEDKSQCCEELEGTCLELKLQLESMASKDGMKDAINEEQKLLQTVSPASFHSLPSSQLELLFLISVI